MAPETALDPQWVDIFSTPLFRKNLALIAIDEAHCICEWLAVTNLISVVDGSRSKLNSGQGYATCICQYWGTESLD